MPEVQLGDGATNILYKPEDEDHEMGDVDAGEYQPQSLIFADPYELIIQPEVSLHEVPKSDIIQVGVLFEGKAYEALFALRPPRILTVARRGGPVDNRLPEMRRLLQLLRESVSRLANQLIVGNVDGVVNESQRSEEGDTPISDA